MHAREPDGTDEGSAEVIEEVTAEHVPDGEGPRPGGAVTPIRPVAADAPDDGPGRGLTATRTGQVVAQAAAVAATGLVAGAATTAIVRAARGRRATRRATGRGRDTGTLGVVETRTYVVDVHLLGRR